MGRVEGKSPSHTLSKAVEQARGWVAVKMGFAEAMLEGVRVSWEAKIELWLGWGVSRNSGTEQNEE